MILNNKLINDIVKFIINNRMNIKFRKVKAHKDCDGNNIADTLSKYGSGILKCVIIKWVNITSVIF